MPVFAFPNLVDACFLQEDRGYARGKRYPIGRSTPPTE